jgi:hypothetical protein
MRNQTVKLMRKPQVIGEGYHRAGWPFAVDALRSIHSESADLLFDDFVEQTWVYSSRTEPIVQPWAGIFHHPPNPPTWTRKQDRLDRLCLNHAFDSSLLNLKLAICLSQYVADWIGDHWDIPTAVVKHPTELPEMKWQPDAWINDKRLLQVGWYLRNVRLIHQTNTPIHRTRLMIKKQVTVEHEENSQRVFGSRPEFNASGVLEIDWIENDGYDFLLSRSVVCMEVLDAAANNVTIECLARNTPLIVNRHPAVVEYLGGDYPLFYEDHRQVAEMINNEELILSAHRYLEQRDKSFLSAESFTDGISKAVEAIQ